MRGDASNEYPQHMFLYKSCKEENRSVDTYYMSTAMCVSRILKPVAWLDVDSYHMHSICHNCVVLY